MSLTSLFLPLLSSFYLFFLHCQPDLQPSRQPSFDSSPAPTHLADLPTHSANKPISSIRPTSLPPIRPSRPKPQAVDPRLYPVLHLNAYPTPTSLGFSGFLDPFGIDALDIAKELNISPYIFFHANAFTLSLVFHLKKLDETVSCEYRDLLEPLKLPGCIPIHSRDLMESVQDRTNDATYHSDQTLANNPLAFLPKGFVERTKWQGLVVPSWAPQAQVLSHGSTGGFLTHCGWNSILESIMQDIPLIAWPLYAEQKMNAVVLAEDVKVALRPKTNKNGLIEQVEIAKVVKGLMVGEEGKKVRNRMKDIKIAAEKALSANGSSTKALSELASQWTNHPGF
ncbi:hydroquinone glucosyltransferase [Quercus suber]|uniref:Hydroquinone glucosyltransferase n=1 Tax=Quercus suber TaxID=58331 RepID=A0AAW0J1Q3_QUESU